jgi:hypothetical protein
MIKNKGLANGQAKFESFPHFLSGTDNEHSGIKNF